MCCATNMMCSPTGWWCSNLFIYIYIYLTIWIWFLWTIYIYHSYVSIYTRGSLYLVGGFNPSEKYESQWEGWHPIYYGKENMFETTNQPSKLVSKSFGQTSKYSYPPLKSKGGFIKKIRETSSGDIMGYVQCTTNRLRWVTGMSNSWESILQKKNMWCSDVHWENHNQPWEFGHVVPLFSDKYIYCTRKFWRLFSNMCFLCLTLWLYIQRS